MCIRNASRQHTAINYLQQCYLPFRLSKPPADCNPFPDTLDKSQFICEADLLAAPTVTGLRKLLLASHVASVLSMRVAEEQNLVNYARSVHSAALWNVKDKPVETHVAKAAEDFLVGVWVLGDAYDPKDKKQRLKEGIFTRHSEDLDDQEHGGSKVMDPVATAVSILIWRNVQGNG